MSTKARYKNGFLEFYDSSTHETNPVGAPVFFYDDFLGSNFLNTESGSDGVWTTVEVALNTVPAITDAVGNGVCSLIIDADNNAEDAVLYMGDVRSFNVKAGLVFECRLAIATPGTGIAVVWGMAGDHNLAKDSVTEAAWFRMDASLALKVETDDTTNNNDDVSTGETLTTGAYHVFKIDFTDISDVRFYLDGASVATGTTYDMSNLTDAEGMMQPYFSLDKATGTGTASMLIDYVKIWSGRSELTINN